MPRPKNFVPLRDREACNRGHKVTKATLYYSRCRSSLSEQCLVCKNQNSRESKSRLKQRAENQEFGSALFFKHTYELSCGHKNTFSNGLPRKEAVVYCYRCTGYSKIVREVETSGR